MAAPLAWLAANPKTALSIGSILAKLGQGFFAGRDLDTAQREQDRRVGYSNLINTFGGRSTPSPVELKPGRATTLLGGLGTALSAGSTLYDLADAKKLRDLQTRAAEQTIAAGDRAAGIAQGQANYAADVQRRANAARQLAPPAAGGTGPSLGQFPGFGGAISEADKLLGKATTGPPISQQPVNPFEAVGRLQAGQEAGERLIGDRLKEAQIDYWGAQGRAAEMEAGARYLAAAGDIGKVDLDKMTKIVESAAQTGRPWSEITTSPSFSNINASMVPVLRATYDAKTTERLRGIDKDVSDYLMQDVKALASQNSMLKKSSDLQFAANLLMTGYDQQNGPGDLQMVTASVRMGDPGMGVRPAEAAQWEQAGGIVQGYLVFGKKFLEGDTFTPEVRNKLLKASLDQYTGSGQLVDEAVGKLANTVSPRLRQLTGMNAMAVPGVRQFFDNYRLPPLESYSKVGPKALAFYRSPQAQALGSSVGGNYQDDLSWLTGYTPQLTQ